MTDLIEQVLFTSPGERVNRPTFGSGLLQSVFAPAGDAMSAALNVTVQSALQLARQPDRHQPGDRDEPGLDGHRKRHLYDPADPAVLRGPAVQGRRTVVIYFCCDDNRRSVLLGNPGLNGIDYVEVLDDPSAPASQQQRTLFVTFVNPMTLPLDAGNMVIDGGERITGITVTSVTATEDP